MKNALSSFCGCICAALCLFAFVPASVRAGEAPKTVQCWDLYEIVLQGPSEGNPFTEVRLSAVFVNEGRSLEVPGFYDGNGVYRIRFMPERAGVWRYETKSNRWPLTGKRGAFSAVPASGANHGPVRVSNTYHFAYADGTPFRSLGTTSYSWSHRSDAVERQTLATLAKSPFNKVRMCVFPQDHATEPGQQPPPFFPYEGMAPRDWDFSRFNPDFFRHLEQRVADLRDLGIEADLILFHPYGRKWNFDTMDSVSDERYLRYLVARLSAFRNVWWSLANEFDLLRTKTEADWDRYFQLVRDADPYGHLRSIHHSMALYDNNKPWVTHASIQNGAAAENPLSAELYRDVWRKPVVYDEVKYEGNNIRRWGQLSGLELVHRFWCGTVAGTYVGHSESLKTEGDKNAMLWLAQGGILKGESAPRLAFLKKVLEDGPVEGIEPIDKWQKPYAGGKAGEYYLIYLGAEAPTSWPFHLYKESLADGIRFKVDVLDIWQMTVTPVDTVYVTKKDGDYYFADEQRRKVPLPGKPYQVLRIQRIDPVSAPTAGEVPNGG